MQTSRSALSIAILFAISLPTGASPAVPVPFPSDGTSIVFTLGADSARLHARSNGLELVLHRAEGAIDTFHHSDGHTLRVTTLPGLAGLARFETLGTAQLLVHATPAQLVAAQTQLDAWGSAATSATKGGAAGCGLEAAAVASATANVAASCGSPSPGCALAWTQYALAMEALERCTASEPLPF
jgi:hypothetical protein